MLLRHFADEATPNGSFGPHRPNFALRDGGGRTWNRFGEVDLAAALHCPCRVTRRDVVGWVDVLIEKTGAAPVELADVSRRRFAAWLEASMRLLGGSALPPPRPTAA